jgi:ATP-dependent Clp protease ATP-binding subunit ClpA
MYPFERFNEDAKRTLTLAQEEAERAHHSYIGTEHLLLGLLRNESGTAYRVLTDLGISIEPVRETIASVLGQNERIQIQQIIPTSRVKQVIEISFEEARRMGHNFADTGHLLMGLVIEGEGIAAHVLSDLGATLEKVIPAVELALGAPVSSPRSKRRRRRPLFSRHGRAPQGVAVSASDLIQILKSDSVDLQRLLGRPRIARLLKSKGVDTDALFRNLGQPPPDVVELRQMLSSAGQAFHTAISTRNFEYAARLRDESRELFKKLEKAEDDWLESLG